MPVGEPQFGRVLGSVATRMLGQFDGAALEFAIAGGQTATNLDHAVVPLSPGSSAAFGSLADELSGTLDAAGAALPDRIVVNGRSAVTELRWLARGMSQVPGVRFSSFPPSSTRLRMASALAGSQLVGAAGGPAAVMAKGGLGGIDGAFDAWHELLVGDAKARSQVAAGEAHAAATAGAAGDLPGAFEHVRAASQQYDDAEAYGRFWAMQSGAQQAVNPYNPARRAMGEARAAVVSGEDVAAKTAALDIETAAFAAGAAKLAPADVRNFGTTIDTFHARPAALSLDAYRAALDAPIADATTRPRELLRQVADLRLHLHGLLGTPDDTLLREWGPRLADGLAARISAAKAGPMLDAVPERLANDLFDQERFLRELRPAFDTPSEARGLGRSGTMSAEVLGIEVDRLPIAIEPNATDNPVRWSLRRADAALDLAKATTLPKDRLARHALLVDQAESLLAPVAPLYGSPLRPGSFVAERYGDHMARLADEGLKRLRAASKIDPARTPEDRKLFGVPWSLRTGGAAELVPKQRYDALLLAREQQSALGLRELAAAVDAPGADPAVDLAAWEAIRPGADPAVTRRIVSEIAHRAAAGASVGGGPYASARRASTMDMLQYMLPDLETSDLVKRTMQLPREQRAAAYAPLARNSNFQRATFGVTPEDKVAAWVATVDQMDAAVPEGAPRIAPAADAAALQASLDDAVRLLDSGFGKLIDGVPLDESVHDLSAATDAWEQVIRGDLLPLPESMLGPMRDRLDAAATDIRRFELDRQLQATGDRSRLAMSLWPHWDALGRMRADVGLVRDTVAELGTSTPAV